MFNMGTCLTTGTPRPSWVWIQGQCGTGQMHKFADLEEHCPTQHLAAPCSTNSLQTGAFKAHRSVGLCSVCRNGDSGTPSPFPRHKTDSRRDVLPPARHRFSGKGTTWHVLFSTPALKDCDGPQECLQTENPTRFLSRACERPPPEGPHLLLQVQPPPLP